MTKMEAEAVGPLFPHQMGRPNLNERPLPGTRNTLLGGDNGGVTRQCGMPDLQRFNLKAAVPDTPTKRTFPDDTRQWRGITQWWV